MRFKRATRREGQPSSPIPPTKKTTKLSEGTAGELFCKYKYLLFFYLFPLFSCLSSFILIFPFAELSFFSHLSPAPFFLSIPPLPSFLCLSSFLPACLSVFSSLSCTVEPQSAQAMLFALAQNAADLSEVILLQLLITVG